MITILIFALLSALASTHLITPTPEHPAHATGYPAIGLVNNNERVGQLPGDQLWKRSSVETCDGVGVFTCDIGTCFTGSDGLVGCCSSGYTCAPRTTCFDYGPTVTTPCDPNTGGCLYCSDSSFPVCIFQTNPIAGQYINFCGTMATTETTSYVPTLTFTNEAELSGLASVVVSSVLTPITLSPPTLFLTIPTPTAIVINGDSHAVSSPVPTTLGFMSMPGSDTLPCLTGTCAPMPLGTVTPPTFAGPSDVVIHEPRGVLAAIGIGSFTGLILLFVAVYFMKKRWCVESPLGANIRARWEKDWEDAASSRAPAGGAATRVANPRVRQDYGISALPRRYSPESMPQRHELESSPANSNFHTPTRAGRGATSLGIGGGDSPEQQHHEATSPDPPSSHTSDLSFPPSYQPVEAPADHPLPTSPPVSSLAAPDSPSSASSSPFSPVSPLNAAYTPSRYAASTHEPPSSLPRTTSSLPPSLPQSYSAVSLQGNGLPASDGLGARYKGLSGGSAETPPWAYLSAEQAANGLWRNEDGSARASRLYEGT